MKLIEWKKHGRDLILTFETQPSWLARLFGSKPREVQYIGSCTVWHHYPQFRRCGIFTEAWLADVWAWVKHQESLKVKTEETT